MLERHLSVLPVTLAFAGGIAFGECWENVLFFLLCSLLSLVGAVVLIDKAPKVSIAALLVALFFVGVSRSGLGEISFAHNDSGVLECARGHFIAQLDVIKDERVRNFIARIVAGCRETPAELEENFYRSGTGHVLAVSGLHLGIVAYIAGVFLKRIVVDLRIRAIVLIIFCGLYALFTGMHPPVVRALIMGALFLIAPLIGRRGELETSIAVASILMLAINPSLIKDAGFQLSYAAIVGICLAHKAFGGRIDKRGFVRYMGRMGISIAGAQFFVMPLTAYHFSEMAPVGLISNIFIVPIVGCVLFAAMVGGIIGTVFAPLGAPFIAGAGVLASFIIWLAGMFSHMPGGYLSLHLPAWGVVIWYIAILGVLWVVKYKVE